ncbi:MAG: TNT domain-containing protein [Actinocatenispora sp.]
MRIRRLAVTAVAAAAMTALVPTVTSSATAATAPAAPRAHAPAQVRPGPARCHTGTPTTAPATTRYLRNQPVLGPVPLPREAPVRPLLDRYRRLGGMTPARFEARFRVDDGWRYPPNDGFLSQRGRVLKQVTRLRRGTSLDRFGYPGGAYLSPAGTPFANRALPPQSLNTPADTPLSNYHEYCVVRQFRVDAGPIAPWFGQPGMGFQFKLNATYLPAAGTALTVTWLLQHGYLVEENPATAQNQAAPGPAAQDPTGQNPVVRHPAAQRPAAQAPAAQRRAAQAPAAQHPAIQRPAAQNPAGKTAA